MKIEDFLFIRFSCLPQGLLEEIGTDGKIHLPFAVSIVASGRTLGEIEQAIRAQYVPKYYKWLDIKLQGPDELFYYISHDNTITSYDWRPGMTILEAINNAEGVAHFAKMSRINLIRRSGETILFNSPETLREPARDLPLYSGDRIVFMDRRS